MRNNQIVRNIAVLIWDKPKKLDQLRKVTEITSTCTSESHFYVTVEFYNMCLVRYLIKGTMSGMTITANPLTRQIIRKPRNIKPWLTVETQCFAHEIYDLIQEIQDSHKRLEVE